MKTLVVSHPKTRLLADILEIRVAEAVGILAMVWNYAKQSAKDGDLSSLTARHLASMLGWAVKDGDRLYAALVEAGWLDPHPCRDGAFVIHDWLQHCEAYVIRDLVSMGRIPEGKAARSVSPDRLYKPANADSVMTCHDGAEQITTAQNKSRPSREKSCFPSPSPSRPASQDPPPNPPRGGRGGGGGSSGRGGKPPNPLIAEARESGEVAARFVEHFPSVNDRAGWSRLQFDKLGEDVARRRWDMAKFDAVMAKVRDKPRDARYPTPTPNEVFSEIRKQAASDYRAAGGAA